MLILPNFQGGNSQNFLRKFVIFFVTLSCFYGVVIHRKEVLYDLYSSQHNIFIFLSASKTTFSHYDLKILRPKVTKSIKNLHKKFCEFRPSCLVNEWATQCTFCNAKECKRSTCLSEAGYAVTYLHLLTHKFTHTLSHIHSHVEKQPLIHTHSLSHRHTVCRKGYAVTIKCIGFL